MEGIPVTLIVKAPNQQIEDQTIKCEPSWTIRRLKGYLSEVYPSKPRTEEQKLIYSGQLLPDTMVLKDVLRRYEGQETHTVHLVCTPPREVFVKNAPINKPPPQTTSQPENEQTSSQSNLSRSEAGSSNANATPVQPENVPSDGTRQRVPFNPASSREEVPFNPGSDSRTAWAGAMSQPYMQAFGVDANTYAVQMAWMQQAYANYMSQYMQLYTNGSSNASNAVSNETNADNNVNPPIANVPVPDNIVPPAVDAVANDAEEGIIDRDWLDWFYLLSRLAILFSIVYFYSSPLRFIIVVLLGITMYLYHIGFFRAQALDNINMNNNVNERVENNNVIGDQNALRQPAPVMENTRHTERPVEERPSVPALMWTFLVTFFASLIPEIPNAV